MFLIRQLIKLIRLLHQDEGALMLSIGFSLSLFAGFCGWNSLLGALSLLIALIFRVQLGAYFFGTLFFSLLSWPFISVFHQIGLRVLNFSALQSLWALMYEQPFFHWLQFNYTVTAGASLVALILFPLVFMATHWAVLKYQNSVLKRLKATRWYKAFIKSSPVVLYLKYLERI